MENAIHGIYHKNKMKGNLDKYLSLKQTLNEF